MLFLDKKGRYNIEIFKEVDYFLKNFDKKNIVKEYVRWQRGKE